MIHLPLKVWIQQINVPVNVLDEVESLAAARKAALSGTEPSDSIRVVNALLTQIDRLKQKRNVLILTTSNITEAIGKHDTLGIFAAMRHMLMLTNTL